MVWVIQVSRDEVVSRAFGEDLREYRALLLICGDTPDVSSTVGHLQGGDAGLPAVTHWVGGVMLGHPKVLATMPSKSHPIAVSSPF